MKATVADIFDKDPIFISKFRVFSKAHLISFSLTSLLIFLGTVISYHSISFSMFYKYFLLYGILVQEIAYKYWSGFTGDQRNLADVFALHMCSCCIALSALTLFHFNQISFEVLYFWSLCGASQALISPDVPFSFPHFRFIQTHISHGMIIASTVYLLAVEHRAVTSLAFIRVVIITNVYALFVYFINCYFGTNYMFLNKKPDSATLLDHLGKWPYYIISLEILLVILFGIAYLPWLFI
ncbi:hypothetical protein RCL1_002439 [Eukaryota sp. TZLM3-RCL]